MDIACDMQQIGLLGRALPVVMALEEAAGSVVLSIEVHRVAGEERSHKGCDGTSLRLVNIEVEMIPH